jgi:hypothetical protein
MMEEEKLIQHMELSFLFLQQGSTFAPGSSPSGFAPCAIFI